MTLRVLFAFWLLVSSVVSARMGQPSAPVPADVQARLSQLLPDAGPTGLQEDQPPTFYDAADLYRYMNGAADAFQGYDVQALLHHDVRAGVVDLTIDIFDMGALENAFGMYAAERSPAYDFVTIGTEGYRNEGILNFFQDRYYVKLAAFGDGADGVLQKIAAAIAERIGTPSAFPPLLSKLPTGARKARTEKYLRKDPLGHAFLGPAYEAVYGFASGESTLMVSLGADRSDAALRMQALQDHFGRTGQWSRAPEYGAGAIRASNSFEGSLVAAPAGRYVVILVNPANTSAAFFKEAVTGLQ